ncbi:MAG: hypothetical protein R6X27_18600 [Candidatus Desulfacyla sp.]
MANLQIKGIDNDVYADLKALAASENRSVSQQVLCLVRGYLNRKHHLDRTKTPAEVLLDLSGSWEDDRRPEEIVEELRSARKSSQKLLEGF